MKIGCVIKLEWNASSSKSSIKFRSRRRDCPGDFPGSTLLPGGLARQADTGCHGAHYPTVNYLNGKSGGLSLPSTDPPGQNSAHHRGGRHLHLGGWAGKIRGASNLDGILFLSALGGFIIIFGLIAPQKSCLNGNAIFLAACAMLRSQCAPQASQLRLPPRGAGAGGLGPLS